VANDTRYYSPAKIEALDVKAEGEPLPGGRSSGYEIGGCEIHGDTRSQSDLKVQLTNWASEPVVCAGCLLDLVRDGYVTVLPRADLRELISGENSPSAELGGDGSVAMGGLVFAW